MIRPANGLTPAGTDAVLSPREQLRHQAHELRRQAAELDALADQLDAERPIISPALVDQALEQLAFQGFRSSILRSLGPADVREVASRLITGAEATHEIAADVHARTGCTADDNAYYRLASQLREAAASIRAGRN